jgi:type I restriction enzyme, R subunit
LPTDRAIQNYRSTYNDIRDWLRREKESNQQAQSTIDWDGVVFEIDLLKSQEINLDYILELIYEQNKQEKTKQDIVEDAQRLIRSSLENRAKEELVVEFIKQTDLNAIPDKASIIDAFFLYAQQELQVEVNTLIEEENLNEAATKRYIASSLKREYATENGTELNEILPKMSPLNPQYLIKKNRVFEKIAALVEKFKGVGGSDNI